MSSRSNVDWQDISWSPKIQTKKGILTTWKDVYPALDFRVYSELISGSGEITGVSSMLGGAQDFLALPLIDYTILNQLFPTGNGSPLKATFTSKTDGSLLRAYDITFSPNSINIQTTALIPLISTLGQ